MYDFGFLGGRRQPLRLVFFENHPENLRQFGESFLPGGHKRVSRLSQGSATHPSG
jgi:hypothetical protein